MKFIKSKTIVVNEFDPSQFTIGEGYAIKHKDQKGYTCGILTAASTGEITFAVYCTKSISALTIRIEDMDMFTISKLISEDFISDVNTEIVEEPVAEKAVEVEPVVVEESTHESDKELKKSDVKKMMKKPEVEKVYNSKLIKAINDWLDIKGDKYLVTTQQSVIIDEFRKEHLWASFGNSVFPSVLNDRGPLKGETFREYVPGVRISNYGRAMTLSSDGKWELAVVCVGTNSHGKKNKMFKYYDPEQKRKVSKNVANAVLTVFIHDYRETGCNVHPIYRNGNELDCRLENLEWSNPKETKKTKTVEKSKKSEKTKKSLIKPGTDQRVVRAKIRNFIDAQTDEYLILKTHSEMIDDFNALYPKMRIGKNSDNRKIFEHLIDLRDIPGEVFVDIERFKETEYDFQISNFGRVRTMRDGRWHILTPSKDKNRAVQPFKNVKIAVARSVLIAFGDKLSEPNDGIVPGFKNGNRAVPEFKNGNHFDCRIENLSWKRWGGNDVDSEEERENTTANDEILNQDLFNLLLKSEDLGMCVDLFKKKHDKGLELSSNELMIPVIETANNDFTRNDIQREISKKYGVFVHDSIIKDAIADKKLMAMK